MDANYARLTLPIYSGAVRITDEEDERSDTKNDRHERGRRSRKETFIRDHIVTVIVAGLMLLEGFVVGLGTSYSVRKSTEERLEAEYAARLEAYKAEQAYQAQASHWLSGEASREAAINQEVDAVAKVIAKLSTDAQKATEACCMLARVMNRYYPNSFQEVAAQASQWMFYDHEANNTFTERDREIAESIVRPYMEDGIVPNGLTDQMVYGEWTQNDFVLRDSYKTTSTMHTWRYQ